MGKQKTDVRGQTSEIRDQKTDKKNLTSDIGYLSSLSGSARPSFAKASAGKQDSSKVGKYQPGKIEQKWQDVWEKDGLYLFDDKNPNPKYYNVVELPYPSGDLHLGHWFAFVPPDVHARYQKMSGRNVFFPNGFDAFGLPAENAAIKRDIHPQDWTMSNIETMTRQFKTMGTMIDWSHKVITCLPDYYKWNQWIFLKMFERGIAYRSKTLSNWCSIDQTVLANEHVENGKCWRCGTEVVQKEVEQWFLRITEYADRLLWRDTQLSVFGSQLSDTGQSVVGLSETERQKTGKQSAENRNLKTDNRIQWPKSVKEGQNNWIGRSTGANVKFQISNFKYQIEVFTTRPDTLFGATFLVVSPEHEFVGKLLADGGPHPSPLPEGEGNRREALQEEGEGTLEGVRKYVKAANKKSELERKEMKEKTGVFSGVYAINPVNNEEIPVWIADYVLMGYGTGAIMAVPASDARDFEFAKKFGLPIKQVIMPETGTKKDDEERRDGGCAIIFNPQTQKYGVFKRTNGNIGFFAGGVNEGEDQVEGILREVGEESGLHNFKHVEPLDTYFVHYYNRGRKVNRVAKATAILAVLENDDLQEKKLEPHEDFELEWLDAPEVIKGLDAWNKENGLDHWVAFFYQGVARAIELGFDKTSDPKVYFHKPYVGPGQLINSGDWDGWEMPQDISKVINWLEEKGMGERKVQYHLHDWSVSRQRYWGTPVPIIYCRNCWEVEHSEVGGGPHPSPLPEGEGIRSKTSTSVIDGVEHAMVPVPFDQLPVELPYEVDYTPKGKAPLASNDEWMNVKCPKCGKDAKRDPETLDTFFDSSWYFYRYMDPKFEGGPFEQELAKKLMPLDIYFGGSEHTLGHTLYARFFTKFFHDIGLVDFDEFALKRVQHGIVLGPDGNRMSKSKGNVINPDDVAKEYGTDTVRLYLCFMMPYEATAPWDPGAISGVYRFLRRVWELQGKVSSGTRLSVFGSQLSDKSQSVVGLSETEKLKTGKLESENRQQKTDNRLTEADLAIMHKTIKKVGEDLAGIKFNTAVASLMEWLNYLSRKETVSVEEYRTFILLLAPFAPHVAEEIWELLRSSTQNHAELETRNNAEKFESVHNQSWPEFDERYAAGSNVTIVVQVNGKVRDNLVIESSKLEDQEYVEDQARKSSKVAGYLSAGEIKKVIYVPGKIINFVVI